MAYDARRYAAAARLWGEALEADPKVADDRRDQHRYNAACAAALAAAGMGEDDPKPDEAARADLRRRGLGWLKAELAACAKALPADEANGRAAVVATLRHWKQDPDLAGVRDGAARAAERPDWGALRAEVDRLLGRAETHHASPPAASSARSPSATAVRRSAGYSYPEPLSWPVPDLRIILIGMSDQPRAAQPYGISGSLMIGATT